MVIGVKGAPRKVDLSGGTRKCFWPDLRTDFFKKREILLLRTAGDLTKSRSIHIPLLNKPKTL